MSGIFCVDALTHLGVITPGSVDVVITSPRYNFGKNYGPEINDKTDMGAYFAEMNVLAQGLRKVLHHDGLIFLNVGTNSANPLHDCEVAMEFVGAGLVLQERIVWVKADDEGGHFTPISSKVHLNNLWESIFIFSLDGKVELDRLAIGIPYADPSNIKRWKSGQTVHCRGDIWRIPYATIRNRAKQRDGHEATFPDELVVRCLRLAEKGRTGLKVLDPCCGTGTVPCIAVEMGHEGVGFDLSADMAASATKNLQAAMEAVK